MSDRFADPHVEGLIRHLGIAWLSAERGRVRATMPLRPRHRAPTGALHGGAIVSLADSTCGYGCFLALPAGATGFTPLDLNANFLRGAARDTVTCDARLLHDGRTTQVWEADILDGDGDRKLALLRCVQLLLHPKT